MRIDKSFRPMIKIIDIVFPPLITVALDFLHGREFSISDQWLNVKRAMVLLMHWHKFKIPMFSNGRRRRWSRMRHCLMRTCALHDGAHARLARQRVHVRLAQLSQLLLLALVLLAHGLRLWHTAAWHVATPGTSQDPTRPRDSDLTDK